MPEPAAPLPTPAPPAASTAASTTAQVRELVEEALPAACEAEEGQVTREDFDERAVEFLLSVSPPVAEVCAETEMAERHRRDMAEVWPGHAKRDWRRARETRRVTRRCARSGAVQAAIAEMAGLNLSGVRNRSAWLMGVLRRFVAESDPFGKSKEQEEATGEGEGSGQKGKGGGGKGKGGKGKGKGKGKGGRGGRSSDGAGPGGGTSTFAAKRRARSHEKSAV